VYVGRRTSQSQTNGVDADGRRRRVDSHLPSTTVPGYLDTGRPGQRSWTVLAVVQVTNQWRHNYSNVMWSRRRNPDTSRAAAFWTNCRRRYSPSPTLYIKWCSKRRRFR